MKKKVWIWSLLFGITVSLTACGELQEVENVSNGAGHTVNEVPTVTPTNEAPAMAAQSETPALGSETFDNILQTTYWRVPVEDYEVSLQDGTAENTMEVLIHKGEQEWSILTYDTTNGYRVPEDITIDIFEGIMGHNGFRIYECYEMGSSLVVCVTDYFAVGENPIHLANSWTCLNSREEEKTPNIYSVDLDGDGITELLCNVQWLADGAMDSKIYHWDGEKVYTLGGTDVMSAEEPNIKIYGVGSIGAEYLPEKNTILAWHWDEATQSLIEKEYEINLEKLEMYEFQ